MSILEKLLFHSRQKHSSLELANVERTLKKVTYKASGSQYFEDNLRKLAERNPDWKLTAKQVISSGRAGEKIYRYTYIRKPVKLILAKKDDGRDAINVIVAGEQVAWIRDDDVNEVLSILNYSDIKYITSHLEGGEYKIVATGGDVAKCEERVAVRVHIGYV